MVNDAQRCLFIVAINWKIIAELQALFHEHNYLVRYFKSTLVNVRANDLKVRADKTPLIEHKKRFNDPMAPEVTAIIVETEITWRDIVICRRNQTKHHVAETL